MRCGFDLFHRGEKKVRRDRRETKIERGRARAALGTRRGMLQRQDSIPRRRVHSGLLLLARFDFGQSFDITIRDF